MKHLLLILLIIQASVGFSKVYYVAPNGNDANPGTKNKPLATVHHAQDLVNPGDTVYIRGGVYNVTQDQFAQKVNVFDSYAYLNKSGTPNARINYWAYPGETPVFDFEKVRPEGFRVVGFHVIGDWIYLKGIEVTGIQITITTHTESYCVYSFGNHNIYEQLKLHDNQGTGLRHRVGGYNLFLNCDAYRNHDSISENKKGGNTDGFGCHPLKGGVGNVFRGCRSWFNSDDGYDVLGAQESVTFENCWSFYNGFSTKFVSLGDGNGFKGGGYGATPVARLPVPIPQHTIKYCLAVRNKANGFYSNHHLQGSFWFNNTAYRNSVNFNMLNRLSDNETDVAGFNHLMKNNIGYRGGAELRNADSAKCSISHNSFDMNVTFTVDDFITLDETVLQAPRKGDGSLPDIEFMKLKPTSKWFEKLKGMGY